MTKPADPSGSARPDRKPLQITANDLQQNPHDTLSVLPHPEVINWIERKIWSPFRGYGRLVGYIGTPPIYASMGYYPGMPQGRRTIPQAPSAYFVLN